MSVEKKKGKVPKKKTKEELRLETEDEYGNVSEKESESRLKKDTEKHNEKNCKNNTKKSEKLKCSMWQNKRNQKYNEMTQEELLAKNRRYAELYTVQAKYYQKDGTEKSSAKNPENMEEEGGISDGIVRLDEKTEQIISLYFMHESSGEWKRKMKRTFMERGLPVKWQGSSDDLQKVS